MSAPVYGRWLGNYFRYHNQTICVVQEMPHVHGFDIIVHEMPEHPWGVQPATRQQFETELNKALALLTHNEKP